MNLYSKFTIFHVNNLIAQNGPRFWKILMNVSGKSIIVREQPANNSPVLGDSEKFSPYFN